MPVAGLFQRREAVQSAVHARGAHAQAYRREATQMHGN